MSGRSVIARWKNDGDRIMLYGPWEETLHLEEDGVWISDGAPRQRVYRRVSR